MGRFFLFFFLFSFTQYVNAQIDVIKKAQELKRALEANKTTAVSETLDIQSIDTKINANTGGVKFSPYIVTPANIYSKVTFDFAKRVYFFNEFLGKNVLTRVPQVMSFQEFQRNQSKKIVQSYWNEISNVVVNEARKGNLLNFFNLDFDVDSKLFEAIFGKGGIRTSIQGYFGAGVSGKLSVNRNPYISAAQRSQWIPDINTQFQVNSGVKIGDKLSFDFNLANKLQFNFEKLNQIKLDYRGDEDQIIQHLEWGNVSFPLQSSLIQGAQTLMGIRSTLKFGPVKIHSTFSQKQSQSKKVVFSNGSKENNIDVKADKYERNKHYFLAHYFRDHYNTSLSTLPVISTPVEITRIEVWITNRNNTTNNTRDIIGFMDLGENQPNNPILTGGGSLLPSGFIDPSGTEVQSNNLLSLIPAEVRNTNNNGLTEFFRDSGSSDNFAKVVQARLLNTNEYSLNTKLGYISLNIQLRADEVLAVAYRYSFNGKEYQVGEFTTDRGFDPLSPQVLYLKLLKNTFIDTSLPLWDLMMKNIYNLNAYNLDPNNFKLNITRLDEQTGVYLPFFNQGDENTQGKPWLTLTQADRLDNTSNLKTPDGFFDIFENITIKSNRGIIIFPVVEPFGDDLRATLSGLENDILDRFVFDELYDHPVDIIEKEFSEKNRYAFKGSYASQIGSDLELNAFNIPEGSVSVRIGSNLLREGTDFLVDYNTGRVQILNANYLSSGLPIEVSLESNDLFGLRRKNFIGLRVDYEVNRSLNLGATYLSLKEVSLVDKITLGNEPINNKIVGFDLKYYNQNKWLTKMVNVLPFYNSDQLSSIRFSGEVAGFFPGHTENINSNGNSGVSYVDDFENTQQVHTSLKNRFAWRNASTPQLFPENVLVNDFQYNKNKAHITFYHVDDLYNLEGSNRPPSTFSTEDQSNHYQRRVLQTEIFPFREIPQNAPQFLQVLNVDYYPTLRGSYNYTIEGLNASNGEFLSPKEKWGGIIRKIDNTDFLDGNVIYLEFWLLDPFIDNPNGEGGDLYFNLGEINEDSLKDGIKAEETSLPLDGDINQIVTSTWGRFGRLESLLNAFSSVPSERALQDVGLDGLNNDAERVFFSDFLARLELVLDPDPLEFLFQDPSSDDFRHYNDNFYSNNRSNAFQRFSLFSRLEGNSRTAQQSENDLNIPFSSATNMPDSEDVNNDNSLSTTDKYYEYKVALKPNELEVGKNFIVDKRTTSVRLADQSQSQEINWYQFRIPLQEYTALYGDIKDFRSIRHFRMFLHDFAQTVNLRFATLRFIRGDWKLFNPANDNINDIIVDTDYNRFDPNTCVAEIGNLPSLDDSQVNVGVVNIEENSQKTPIPYTLPPGIDRETNFNSLFGNTLKNEQSYLMKVDNMNDGLGRAVFKNVDLDFRNYANLEMYIHAEGDNLNDGDVQALIRVGSDQRENYYEIAIPLKITPPGTGNPDEIWPRENFLQINIGALIALKIQRDQENIPATTPFTQQIGNFKVTILGFPDLSKVRLIMLGALNPLRCTNPNDDGLQKSVELWFNELRLTEFNEEGGWATTFDLNSDIGGLLNISVAGSFKDDDFDSLDASTLQKDKITRQTLGFQTRIDLGKLFPKNLGLKIPTFFAWNYDYELPKFDPYNPDIEFATAKNILSTELFNALKRQVEGLSIKRTYNFSNVRINRPGNKKKEFWDLENLSFSFSLFESSLRNHLIENNQQLNYKGNVIYQFSPKKINIAPFKKLINNKVGKYLGFIKNFNFSPIPSLISARVDFNREFNELLNRNPLQNSEIFGIRIDPTYKKLFHINRNYAIKWNLSKSLNVNFDAFNQSVVDEPPGKLEGLKRDTLINNLKKFGRTVKYKHDIRANYKIPFSQIIGLHWIQSNLSYQSFYQWDSQSLQTIKDPNLNLGNTILNSRVINLNTRFNLSKIFKSLPFMQKEGNIFRNILRPIEFVKSFTVNYSRNESTFIPGYTPKTQYLGMDSSFQAPGLAFILGSQKDIRQDLAQAGWISRDENQNQQYLKKFSHQLSSKLSFSPIKDLRINFDLEFQYGEDFSSNFKYDNDLQSFQNFSSKTTGSFKISTILINSAFKSSRTSQLPEYISNYLANKPIISRRLGASNPHSNFVDSDGFAEGYSPFSQDVIVPSLFAALKNQDPSKASLNPFNFFPLPNWRLSYDGLSKIPGLDDVFKVFSIQHQYKSTFAIGSFISDNRYLELLGYSFERNNNNDFLPRFEIGNQLVITEAFSPLIGVNMRFENGININVNYTKARNLAIGLSNSEISLTESSGLVFGFAFRKQGMRLFEFLERANLENDVSFRVDFSIKDNITVIYRLDEDFDNQQITAGAKIIYFQPSIKLAINQSLNASFFVKGNITQPYTTLSFYNAFYEIGINFRYNFSNDQNLSDIIDTL